MSALNRGRDLFTNLPLEMLHEIAGYLSLCDRLNLRAVFSKAQDDVVAELIGPILKTIYLSPSAHSIFLFHRLLSSAFFRRHIRTVVYIPCTIANSRLKELSYLHQLESTHNIHLTQDLAEASYDLYKTTYEEHVEGSFSLFASFFLAPDLAQLLSLCRLEVTTGAKFIGLNASRLWSSVAHSEERTRLGLSVLRETTPGIAVEHMLEPETDGLNDAALFVATEQGRLQPTMLTLDYLTPQSLSRVSELLKPLAPESGKSSLIANVKTLEIGLPGMTDEAMFRQECADAWYRIAQAATQLEKLKIVVERSTNTLALAASPRAVDYFLYNERYAVLRTLELNAEPYYCGCVSAKTFLQWLRKYGSSSQLREIKLNNILLVPYPNARGASEATSTDKSSFKQGIRTVLLEACKLRLLTFKMKIDRKASYSLPCSPFARARAADAAWLDELAREMRVGIGQNGWDFGEYVMNNPWKDEDGCMEDA